MNRSFIYGALTIIVGLWVYDYYKPNLVEAYNRTKDDVGEALTIKR